jgi:phosphate starvation-inducible membrane PsiE
MNWEHLRAFLWLRSRLNANKSKRASSLSNTLNTILMVLAVVVGIAAFTGSLALSYYVVAKQSPSIVLYVWDGVVAVFLFFWFVILSVELQRSELLPLEKFLHYPISVSGLFLINYIASVLSEHIAVFLFVPAMLGLSLGLVIVRGIAMLWLFPLLLAFLLMVTAVTYQFRGWLAVLMLNKRHRRTVVTVVTLVSVLLFQLPYISTRVFGGRRSRGPAITNNEQAGQIAKTVSMTVPLGWLPYGAMAAAEGRFLPPVLGIMGMTLIGAISLRRSYRTTVRLYTGNYGSGQTKKASTTKAMPAAVISPKETAEHSPQAVPRPAGARSFLEMQLPWVSEQASVVAVTTFRSLTRAPEAKMVLLSPLVMIFIFGTSVVRMSSRPGEFTRPLMASAVLAMILFGMGQLAGNQFSFDRSGFRNFVLAAAPRREILLGKNLALAPLILGLALVAVIFLQVYFPMRLDYFVAALCQMVTMFLLFCLFSNFVSILNPTPIRAGSLKPAVKPSGKTILFGLLTVALFPFALAPSMVPLGLEIGLHWLGWFPGVPISLLFSVGEVLAVGYLYSWVLDRQGELLQSRELRILDVVSARAADS